MAHWLFKSEPSAWSYEKLAGLGAAGTDWSGVRNHTAKLNMQAMKVGEHAFFYHSNEGKEIVGIVEVCKAYRPDPTDATGKFGMQVDELKGLVKALHQNGIEIFLDVVFNHTAEGNEKGPSISFRGLDNRTYYMLTPEGYYYNFSGTATR